MNSAIRSVIALKLSDIASVLDAQKRHADADLVEGVSRRLSQSQGPSPDMLMNGNTDLATGMNSERTTNSNPWMTMMDPTLLGNSTAMPQIGQQYHVPGNAKADGSMGHFMGVDGFQADAFTKGDWSKWGPQMMQWSQQNAPQQYLQYMQGVWKEYQDRIQRTKDVNPNTQNQVSQNVGIMGEQQGVPSQAPQYAPF